MSRIDEVVYTVTHQDPEAHLLSVDVEVAGDLGDELVLFMPVWTPGSYLVREYARHVEGVRTEGARPVKVRKNAWRVKTGGASRVRVSYRVYANDLTVRTNHVDRRHAYWNGASTYLFPEGVRDFAAKVRVRLPEGWSVGTALARNEDGTFRASGIDELCDSPFECGPMEPVRFDVLGKGHTFWIADTGHQRAARWEDVVRDTKILVETEAKLLSRGGPPAESLPYDEYCFLWTVSPRGRGGLEHERSCSLLVSPSSFSGRSGYLDVLSLVAHEFLHLWNVKRIKPAGLVPYRYEEENHTRLLFWFEGGTSYFDWRILRLSGLATAREYLDHLGAEIGRVLDTPGARVHALSDASFDAWVKAYRPDENSQNSTISYYVKGEVVCALLDLVIRARSGGEKGLDHVLRHLYWAYACEGRPVPEDGFGAAVLEATGVDVSLELARWVESADPIDPSDALSAVGLRLDRRPVKGQTASLGVRTKARGSRVFVDGVVRGSAAMKAGLDVGDELLAVAGRRVEDTLDVAMGRLEPGAKVTVIVSREGIVETREVVLDPPLPGEARLVPKDDASPAERALFDGWLGEGAFDTLRKPS